MYTIILVEDNSMQREILKRMIIPMYDFIRIYEADSEITALDIIKKYHINMFLIDICLKESSGLNLALKIRNMNEYQFSQIIFITTHIEYITQAFKQTHCYDYILKPYTKKDIQAMLKKIILHEKSCLKNPSNTIIENKEVVITLKNGIYIGIKLNTLFFIEVKGKNCEIHTTNGIFTANNISLKKLLIAINCKHIIQSHRAFAININYIHKIEKLSDKLSIIYFIKYLGTALLGYKFKDSVISEFKNGKVLL